MLVGDDVVFVFGVGRLVLWRDVDVFDGEERGDCGGRGGAVVCVGGLVVCLCEVLRVAGGGGVWARELFEEVC